MKKRKKTSFLVTHQVRLVPDQELVHTLGRVAVDLREPLLDVVERLLVGHVVDDLRKRFEICGIFLRFFFSF